MKIFYLLSILTLSGLSKTFAQAPEKWMDWTPTNCYEKIEYRVRYMKTNGSRHEWQLQFRNNFNRLIVFNYGIEEDATALALTTHRKTLKPQEVSEPVQVYTQKENFFLFTDKLSFNIDGRDNIPCDEN